MRWPLRQVFDVLLNGLPALRTVPVTPLTLTVPHERVVTCVGLTETCDASACPLAPALVPGKNIASDASPATERSPAGRRKRLVIVFLSGTRTPRMPT